MMGHGPARPIKQLFGGPRPGPARQIFRGWVAAMPGPSNFHRMGRGPTQPIIFSKIHGPGRPGSSFFQMSPPGPDPSHGSEAHDTRALYGLARQLCGPARVFDGPGRVNGLVAVKGGTDHDWRALECVRANGLDEGVQLVRWNLGEDCMRLLSDLSPSIVMGDASRKPAKQGPVGMATLAKDIVKVSIDSTATVLLLECHPNLLRSTEWGQVAMPALREAARTVETVELAASSVGVPSGKRKAFAVGIRRKKPGREGERLREWRRDLERRDSRLGSLGGFLSRRGTYFLKGGWERRGSFPLMIPLFPLSGRTS